MSVSVASGSCPDAKGERGCSLSRLAAQVGLFLAASVKRERKKHRLHPLRPQGRGGGRAAHNRETKHGVFTPSLPQLRLGGGGAPEVQAQLWCISLVAPLLKECVIPCPSTASMWGRERGGKNATTAMSHHERKTDPVGQWPMYFGCTCVNLVRCFQCEWGRIVACRVYSAGAFQGKIKNFTGSHPSKTALIKYKNQAFRC